jgi:hypothetical protein
MSQENVEIVRRVLQVFNALSGGERSSESEALAELVDPQIEFQWHDERTMPDTPQHLGGVPEMIGLRRDAPTSEPELMPIETVPLASGRE